MVSGAGVVRGARGVTRLRGACRRGHDLGNRTKNAGYRATKAEARTAQGVLRPALTGGALAGAPNNPGDATGAA